MSAENTSLPPHGNNGMYPVDPREEKTYIRLDFDGASGLSYLGKLLNSGEELSIDGITVESANLDQQTIDALLRELNARFTGSNVEFVTELPEGAEAYSTIHVGDTSAFDSLGGPPDAIYENIPGEQNDGFVIPGGLQEGGFLKLVENICRTAGGLLDDSLEGGSKNLPTITYAKTRIDGAMYGFFYQMKPESLFWCTSNSDVNGNASFSNGATLLLDSGGRFANMSVSGEARVFCNGSIEQLTLNDGWVFAYTGSLIGPATVTGGVFRVAGGSSTDTTITGGAFYVEEYLGTDGTTTAGHATSNKVTGSGVMHVNGGTAVDTELSSGGTQNVSGGMVENTTLYESGVQRIYSGGSFTNTIFEGGTQFIHSGAAAENCHVSNGLQVVDDGGTARDTEIISAGSQQVRGGGLTERSTIGDGGILTVHSGGTADESTVDYGGLIALDESAVLAGEITVGGSMHLSGTVDAESATVTLDLSRRSAADGQLINDLSLLPGGIDKIRTGGQSQAGSWLLAGNAAGHGNSLDIAFEGGGTDAVGGFHFLSGASRYSGAAEDDKRLQLRYDSNGALELFIHERYQLLGNDSQECVADDASYRDMRSGALPDSYYARLTGGEQYLKSIYGGGSVGDHTGKITIDVEQGAILSGYLFGGGYGKNATSTELNIFAGSVLGGYLFGGGRDGDVTGSATVNASGGTYDNLLGGGLANQAGATASVASAILNIGEITAQNVNSFIFGGGMTTGAGATTRVNSITINLRGGNVSYLHGGGYATNGTAYAGKVEIIVESGSASGYLYGAGRAEGSQSRAETESVDITIKGGSFQHLFGGGYAKTGGSSIVTGDVNITISGGTFGGTIYGGAQLGSDTGTAGVDGNISITIDLTGTNSVNFSGNGGITVGGNSTSYVTGDTTLILTGTGSNLKSSGGAFTGWLNASGCGTDASRTHTLSFRDYQDESFQAKIRGFNQMDFSGDTSVTVTLNSAWSSGMDFSFDLTERGSALHDTAFLVRQSGNFGITVNSDFFVKVSYDDIVDAGGDSGSILLIDGNNISWSFGDAAFNLDFFDGQDELRLTGSLGQEFLFGDSGLIFQFEFDDGRLALNWAWDEPPLQPSKPYGSGQLA